MVAGETLNSFSRSWRVWYGLSNSIITCLPHRYRQPCMWLGTTRIGKIYEIINAIAVGGSAIAVGD